jgi:hypothetical protein
MKWIVGSTLGVVLAMSAAAGAQSAKGMDKPMKGGMSDASYTGCVEAGSGGGLVLTHVSTGQQMPMKGDDMPMKGEEAAMKGKEMPSTPMDDDHMMPKSVRLVGSPDLGKHNGQRVTIKGTLSHDTMAGMQDGQPALKVVSFKVVSKSCS